MTNAVRTRDGRGQALVEGEFLFTNEDFTAIARMLYDDAGIALTESKASLVYSRLAKRLRVLGIESFQDYCRLVAGSEGTSERQNMLAALTTNVTRFFREQHHFDHLRTQVLPGLVARARTRGRVRIWSAGCSTGQEPYSIALTILDALPEAAGLDVRILATDIDPIAVTTTIDNAVENGVGEQIDAVEATGLDHDEITARAPYDLVVANILAGPLTELAPGVGSITQPGGAAILSGILNTQADGVIAAYQTAGFALKDHLKRKEWTTLVLEKN